MRDMGGIPYIKFYASDWRAGTTNTLSLDEEGLYIRACVFMWSTGEPVPGNDRLAAKALCVQPLRYEKLMAGLVAKGKMIRGQGSVFNERVMDDLAEYRREQAENSERTKKGWDKRRSTIAKNAELAEAVAAIKEPTPRHTPRHTPPHTPHHTGGVTTPVAAEKPNDYNGEFLHEQWQPEARSQKLEKKEDNTPAGHPDAADALACLNGIRFEMVETMAGWISPYAPDRKTAESWLQTSVGLYGGEVVKQAFGELRAKITQGDLVARPIPLLGKICQRIKADGLKKASAKPFPSRYGLGGPRR
jgi:uncharacterized protein YdaU (DUF1376 family)